MALGLHLAGKAGSVTNPCCPWRYLSLARARLESPTSVLTTASFTLAHTGLWAPAWFLVHGGLSANPCGGTRRVLVCKEGVLKHPAGRTSFALAVGLLEPGPIVVKPCSRFSS